jgi:hypothetical protein
MSSVLHRREALGLIGCCYSLLFTHKKSYLQKGHFEDGAEEIGF